MGFLLIFNISCSISMTWKTGAHSVAQLIGYHLHAKQFFTRLNRGFLSSLGLQNAIVLLTGERPFCHTAISALEAHTKFLRLCLLYDFCFIVKPIDAPKLTK